MATKKTPQENLRDFIAAMMDTSTSDSVKNVVNVMAEMVLETDKRTVELITALENLTAEVKALRTSKKTAKK